MERVPKCRGPRPKQGRARRRLPLGPRPGGSAARLGEAVSWRREGLFQRKLGHRILRLSEEAFADFLEGRALRAEYFELPPPQITGNFLDRTVGLRVGTAHYGARVAGYEWDHETEVFRLTSIHYPELFEALTPPKE